MTGEDFGCPRRAAKEQDDLSCKSPVAGTIHRGGDVGMRRGSPSQVSRVVREYWIINNFNTILYVEYL